MHEPEVVVVEYAMLVLLLHNRADQWQVVKCYRD